MTERQRDKLEKDIAAAKAQLRREKKMFGAYDDSYGARYYIAEKYFLLGDHKKSLRYRPWFYKHFPDDFGNPELHLFWLIAGFLDGKMKIGVHHLIDLEELNLYVVPLILGKEVDSLDSRHMMNLSTLEYALSVNAQWRKKIPEEAIALLHEKTNHPIYLQNKEEMIAGKLALSKEYDTEKRGLILERREELIEHWKLACEKLF